MPPLSDNELGGLLVASIPGSEQAETTRPMHQRGREFRNRRPVPIEQCEFALVPGLARAGRRALRDRAIDRCASGPTGSAWKHRFCPAMNPLVRSCRRRAARLGRGVRGGLRRACPRPAGRWLSSGFRPAVHLPCASPPAARSRGWFCSPPFLAIRYSGLIPLRPASYLRQPREAHPDLPRRPPAVRDPVMRRWASSHDGFRTFNLQATISALELIDEVRPLVGEITTPTLIIQGRLDTVVEPVQRPLASQSARRDDQGADQPTTFRSPCRARSRPP